MPRVFNLPGTVPTASQLAAIKRGILTPFGAQYRILASSHVQGLVAATTILANKEDVRVSSTGDITLTATPTIANGNDGQVLYITNVGSFSITIQDGTTFNLELGAATFVLGAGEIALFKFIKGDSVWCLVAGTSSNAAAASTEDAWLALPI